MTAFPEVEGVKLSLAELNADLAAVAERVRPSLVRVISGRRGAGAGVIVHEEGLVVTNAHVIVSGSPKVEIGAGRWLAAERLALDSRRDLAVLAIEPGEYPALTIGDSQRVRAGTWVLAFGHPFGVLGGATAGTVIGVGSDLPETPDLGADWLALALHLRPGHSGGPVVDGRGRLIGVNARMAGPDVGLAVPAHEVKAFLKEALGRR